MSDDKISWQDRLRNLLKEKDEKNKTVSNGQFKKIDFVDDGRSGALSDKDLKFFYDEVSSLSKEQYDEVLKIMKDAKTSDITHISTDYHCPNYGFSRINCQCDYCKKAAKDISDFVKEKQDKFPGLVKEYLKHHTAQELADQCDAAPATINRWANDTASPRLQLLCWVSDYIVGLAEKENWHG